MTIKKRLYISFALILSIIIFIIGIFFYAIYTFNKIHTAQTHRYDQLLRVEKLQEFNNSFAWIVLDIITDYEKSVVVQNRISKSKQLFETLISHKQKLIENAESKEERENLILIFSNFIKIENFIEKELYTLVLSKNEHKNFEHFNKEFEFISKLTKNLLLEEMSYLQKKLQETENRRNHFIETIKIELVLVLLVAFIVSFIISSKIIREIKGMLYKLNSGVLQLFNTNEETIKIDLGEQNELSEITNNLNLYLEKQVDIIHSREELLRNISHELKTPITKGKFLLENLKHSYESDELSNINSVFVDIEELTSKLLQREKLNFVILEKSDFKVSSLILNSLSKLSIDDESKIVLNIEDDFIIEADKYYLTIALKNLLDNAMKYATEYPVLIDTKDNSIYIKNIAEKLSNDFIYYIQPFTREPNQQRGHGLGLNIVNKIAQMHDFTFNYTYKKPYNIFSISCKSTI